MEGAKPLLTDFGIHQVSHFGELRSLQTLNTEWIVEAIGIVLASNQNLSLRHWHRYFWQGTHMSVDDKFQKPQTKTTMKLLLKINHLLFVLGKSYCRCRN